MHSPVSQLFNGDRAGFRFINLAPDTIALTTIILPAIYPIDNGLTRRLSELISKYRHVDFADAIISDFLNFISLGRPVDPDVCAVI